MTTPQPYPACKPSGVPWLGDVPAHWEVRRLKNLQRRLAPKFVSYLAQSNAFTERVTAASVGTAYPAAIAESRLGSFHVPLPPHHEQAAIVEYLDKATAGIDAAIARARRQMELLEEYRTRLIADVVTGKLDVREAAAARLEPYALER